MRLHPKDIYQRRKRRRLLPPARIIKEEPREWLAPVLKDAHERRLSGAVLAHEREDLARANFKRHIVERADHTEALRDAEDGENRRRWLSRAAALALTAWIAASGVAAPLPRAYL